MKLLALAVSISVCSFAAAQQATWPCFRGNNHGVASSKPPLEWSKDKNLAWRTALPGPGASSPIVVGDGLYLTYYSGFGAHLDDNGKRAELRHHLVRVDRKTGKVVWDKDVPGRLTEDPPRAQLAYHGFATPTPASDGKHIYAYFGRGGAVAFDLDGKVLWQQDLGRPSKDAPKRTNAVVRQGKELPLRWGAAGSPVLFGERVFINASEESNSVRALDKKTGKLLWKYESANLEGCATTPLLVKPANAKVSPVLVVVLGGEVWGLDPETGKLRWSVETGTRGGMSPTPVFDQKLVYTFGGMGKSFALRYGQLAKQDTDSKPSRVRWQGENIDIPSPILHDGKLYLVRQQGVGMCVDAQSGKVLFQGKLGTGHIYASPVLSNGHLYIVSRRRGTFIFKVDGKFERVARNRFEDNSMFNATPAVVDDQIFLRSDRWLYCVAKKD